MSLLNQFIDRYTPDWRLSDSALIALGRLLDDRNPHRVLEVGPGASSLVLLPWCLEHEAVYRGLDHCGPYHEKHLSVLQEAWLPTETTFAVRLDETTKWYSWVPPAINLYAPFDLVLIDGPIAGRDSAPAMVAYERWGHDQTVWVVDDTHRGEERLVSAWAVMNGHRIERVLDLRFPRYTDILIPEAA